MARLTNHTRHRLKVPIAAAAACLAAQALAQTTSTGATQLQPITVTGRASPPATVSGWGDLPLSSLPLQASVFGSELLKDLGAQRLSDLTRLDPAISDAYNAEGYWDFLTVRGYVLDNRFNFRRDGLPINAETSIPLDNKARVEILKGTSGLQSGTSSPGGLVNHVVKRPLDTPLRSVGLEWRQPGSVTAWLDLNQRFGTAEAFGLRVNAAAARLDPMVRDSRGHRTLLAIAGDWRLTTDTVLEAEVETSRRSQPSQPGFSLLGDRVPAPGNPRLSLNNQPWSQPVVMDADTASLRWQQRLGAGWRFVAHAATQRLRTDDRLAFPFGCFDPAPLPDGTYYPDRYCPDGTYDLYDFRSENERRRSDALDLALNGKLQTGWLRHTLTVGALQSRVRNRFQRQAYNFVGTGNVDGTTTTEADPTLTDENTDRDERSTELYARDAIALTDKTTAWLGVRHTRLDRRSVRTDGSRPTGYEESFTTPHAALSHAFAPGQLVYASWGEGVESIVTANRPRYVNASEAFTTKSRQIEIGLKGASDALEWNIAAFQIRRPRLQDFGACDVDSSCTSRLDGEARHDGVEATAAWRQGAWTLVGGGQWLRARVEGSQLASIEGRQPPNVPRRTFKMQAAHDVGALPGLTLQAGIVHEGARQVLPDNSASVSSWSRTDLGLRYRTRVAGTDTTWRAGIDNLFDKRAWRESPYQFSHAYLYPLAPRTMWLSVQVDL